MPERQRIVVWWAVPMFGVIVTLLMMSPLLLPTYAAEDRSVLERLTSVETRQTVSHDEVAEIKHAIQELNAKVDRYDERMNIKVDTFTHAVIAGLLTIVAGMGASLWAMRKR